MAAEGELSMAALNLEVQSLEDRLKSLINASPVVLFMKGAPGAERCGFSRTMVGMLQGAGVDFGTFDILQDEEVRQGLKTFSNWPTYPQLYVKGELIGGKRLLSPLFLSRGRPGA